MHFLTVRRPQHPTWPQMRKHWINYHNSIIFRSSCIFCIVFRSQFEKSWIFNTSCIFSCNSSFVRRSSLLFWKKLVCLILHICVQNHLVCVCMSSYTLILHINWSTCTGTFPPRTYDISKMMKRTWSLGCTFPSFTLLTA